MPKTKVVIPARLRSKRLPEKLLLSETGKPLIQHTYEAVARCPDLDEIAVATNSRAIAETVLGFGGNVIWTGEAANGTERVYLATLDEQLDTRIINVQADEPTLNPDWLSVLSVPCDAQIVTLAKRATISKSVDPNCVKVVFSQYSYDAMYFSRSPIPYNGFQWEHIGIYAYDVAQLRAYYKLPVAATEFAENLEQLRALEHGWKIRVLPVSQAAEVGGIDTRDDYNSFVAWFKSRAQ